MVDLTACWCYSRVRWWSQKALYYCYVSFEYSLLYFICGFTSGSNTLLIKNFEPFSSYFSELYLISVSRRLSKINWTHVTSKRIPGWGRWGWGVKWLRSAKFAVFQVKRPGMHQRQVAPSWALWVLHDSDSYGFYHHGQGERQASGGGGGWGWMSVDETVQVWHSKVWEIRREKWRLGKK